MKSHMSFYNLNYDIYETCHEDGHSSIPHTCANLPPFLSVEATGVCISIGNTELLFVAVYKFSQTLWSDTDITELLGFRNKSILADDLNANHPVWNNKVSHPSGLKPSKLFVSSNFHILPPQCPTHYTPDGKCDFLDTVVHQNVIVTDILDSDYLQKMFSFLDTVRTREALDPVEKLTDWELFQNLASELTSPNIQIHFSNEADKAARDF
jgi:hypothetical protein